MKRFGFLSFGHYSLKPDKTGKYGAQEALKQAVELGQIADELGVNGAYFRVHHFAHSIPPPSRCSAPLLPPLTPSRLVPG